MAAHAPGTPLLGRNERLPLVFGDYLLVEQLGVGGMAEIYRGRRAGAAGFEKSFAVKRLHPHVAERPDLIERFVAEAKMLAALEHPNVVDVYELGRTPSGEYFIAMELIDGADLSQILGAVIAQQATIVVPVALAITGAILGALAHAHTRLDEHGRALNIVHRDVSPSNVFVSRQGAVKLGDFGLAKVDELRPPTAMGQVTGKAHYTAPELLNGRGPADARVDVFSTAVVCWELITGRRLFDGRHAFEVASLVMSGQRPRPSLYAVGVPPALDAVLLRALEIEPMHRQSSAAELAAELADVAQTLGPRVTPREVAELVRAVGSRRVAPSSAEHTPDRQG